MKHNRKNFTKEEIELAISNTKSMIGAARYLGISRDKFKRYAMTYNLYEPNQSGRGMRKKKVYTDEEVFSNRGCEVSSTILINRLKDKREWCCEKCGISEWFGRPLSLEIHHIDGNRHNNELSNLQILCPNCHSLTDNWRSRNQKGYSKTNPKVSDEDIINALNNHKSIFEALQSLGLSGGSNYKRVYDILSKLKL